MKFRYITKVLFGLILFSQGAFATEDMYPKINESSIKGTWDAISDTSITIFHMEILSQENSYLSFSTPGLTETYKLVNKNVHNGKVSLTFQAGKNIYLLVGHGVAGSDGEKDEGVIEGELILNPSEKPLNKSKIKFLKGEYISELGQFSQRAKEAIKKEKLKEDETKNKKLKK